MPALEILTVGHSNHDGEAFVDLLRGAGVGLVADVRANPRSRYPQFNRSALAGSLKEAGIDYAHLGEQLGGRRQPSPDSPNRALPEGPFRGYADHMGSDAFTDGLAELKRLATSNSPATNPAGGYTAVMCAEGDWRHCHRRLVADALAAEGVRVLHLGPSGSLSEHELSESAVEQGDRLIYPEAQTSLDV